MKKKRGARRRGLAWWSLFLTVGVGIAAAACGGGLDSEGSEERDRRDREDFALPLASAGTPVIQHPYVPSDAASRIELPVERRVLVRPSPDRPETLFFNALGLDVDPDGLLYVYDRGNARIQVFGQNGDFVRTIGNGPGEGPGQFGMSGEMVVAGERLYYVALNPSRLVTWTTAGEHVSTVNARFRLAPQSLHAIASGVMVGAWTRRPAGLRRTVIGRIGADGAMEELIVRAGHPRYAVTRGSRSTAIRGLPVPEVNIALSQGAVVYVTASDRYEVLSLDVQTKEEKRLLRVPWPPIALTEADQERFAASVRESVPDFNASEFDWPQFYPSLSTREFTLAALGRLGSIHVDGHDRLLVFPFLREDDLGAPHPVDIYDSTGSLVCNATMPRISWLAASGDHVFGIELNEESEQEIVRYSIDVDACG